MINAAYKKDNVYPMLAQMGINRWHRVTGIRSGGEHKSENHVTIRLSIGLVSSSSPFALLPNLKEMRSAE